MSVSEIRRDNYAVNNIAEPVSEIEILENNDRVLHMNILDPIFDEEFFEKKISKINIVPMSDGSIDLFVHFVRPDQSKPTRTVFRPSVI